MGIAEPNAYGVGLYEMANMYFKALAEVGDPTKHEAIGKAIGKEVTTTEAGVIQFDPKSHVALQDADHVPVSFWQIWDGKRALVKPDKYAAAKFRLPPWMSK